MKNFIPPSLEELSAYCKERNNRVSPLKWLAHYQSNGWMVGKNKMKDWKAAVRTWEHSEYGEQKPVVPAAEVKISEKQAQILDKAMERYAD